MDCGACQGEHLMVHGKEHCVQELTDHSFSGISFLLLLDLFNFLVPQMMVNKALQQLLNDLLHGNFNWQMQLPWFFIVLINSCYSSQSLFWILKVL